MASDFYDLRPEQVPNAVTQSFPNVHFLAKSSTVHYYYRQTSAPGGVAAPKILPRDFLYCSRSVGIKEVCFV